MCCADIILNILFIIINIISLVLLLVAMFTSAWGTGNLMGTGFEIGLKNVGFLEGAGNGTSFHTFPIANYTASLGTHNFLQAGNDAFNISIAAIILLGIACFLLVLLCCKHTLRPISALTTLAAGLLMWTACIVWVLVSDFRNSGFVLGYSFYLCAAGGLVAVTSGACICGMWRHKKLQAEREFC